MNNQLVCIAKANWEFIHRSRWMKIWGWFWKKPIGPKFNEIVTVAYETPDSYALKEYNYYAPSGERYIYDKRCFAPLISDSELESLLKEVNESMEK